MKKTITIVLLICLSIGMAFAAGNFKVGLQAGYTGNPVSYTSEILGKDVKFKHNLYGFYVAATAECPIKDEFGVKAEFGVEFLKEKEYVNETEYIPPADEQPGIHFTAFLGPKYCFELADKFCLDAAIGVNIIFGREVNDAEKSYNFALGAGAEITAFYEVVSNLEVGLGGKFAWHFLNTREFYKDMKKDDSAITNIAFQVNAAVKYAF